MDKNLFSNRLKLNSITLTDDFWLEKSELVRREMIPYQLSALNDNIEGAEKSYCLENFKKASIIVENMKKVLSRPNILPTDGIMTKAHRKMRSTAGFFRTVMYINGLKLWRIRLLIIPMMICREKRISV